MKRIEQRKQRRRKRLKKFIYITLALLVLVGGAITYYAFQTYQAASSSYDDLGREKSEKRDEAVDISKDPFSILVMGLENYQEDDPGRTDTLILLTYDPEDQSVKMVSIPRDTRVDFAGMDRTDKINHAYAYGDKEMTIDTVSKFLDIPVDYYATVDFNAFTRTVNVLGGLTVDVPFDFEQKSMAPNSYMIDFQEGEQHLNGEEALAFVRMRKEDPRGDLGRIDRQQEFLNSLADEAMSLKSIFKSKELANVVGEEVTTNVRIREGIQMLTNLNNFDSSNIDSLTLETYNERIGGISYQIPVQESLTEVKQSLKQHMEIGDTEETSREGEQNAQASEKDNKDNHY
ncbi:LCP family protein [Alkalibacillus almallahensis]|uniref:LCP family protein n=1 Tax=Alkalibacillus almallahensis TaxID=1379154 RepID=UPI00141D8680|nr:LCP family protein [Alkalibacillus almallahensis]NIK11810.1 LCP family protein required for cell wall assembly [Alkalibacillus almallahensis]